MITSRQLRAARALAGLDQAALAKAAHLSLPTIQRMEASDGVVLAATALALALALRTLLVNPPAATLALPIGLPWLGAHFRLDALAAAFILVINLGAAMASLYGLGYGSHEEARARVLPFFV